MSKKQERDGWERERERLHQENEKLKKQLEEAQRAAKRQAAPFAELRGAQKSLTLPDGTNVQVVITLEGA